MQLNSEKILFELRDEHKKKKYKINLQDVTHHHQIKLKKLFFFLVHRIKTLYVYKMYKVSF